MKRLTLAAALAAASLTAARADIVSTVGLTQVAAPSLVTGDFIISSNGALPAQLIFNERQGVTLSAPLVTDTGVIAAGTVVDSYFFAENAPSPGFNGISTSVTFSSAVLGLIYLDGSNPYGPNPSPFNPNYASSNFLGAVGTTYQLGGFAICGAFCGFEPPPNFDLDTASFQGNSAFFTNYYSQPGDFARIIVRDPVGVPGPIAGAGLPGVVAGLLGLWGWLRRRTQNRSDLTHIIQLEKSPTDVTVQCSCGWSWTFAQPQDTKSRIAKISKALREHSYCLRRA
jgi:hypothetical protein